MRIGKPAGANYGHSGAAAIAAGIILIPVQIFAQDLANHPDFQIVESIANRSVSTPLLLASGAKSPPSSAGQSGALESLSGIFSDDAPPRDGEAPPPPPVIDVAPEVPDAGRSTFGRMMDRLFGADPSITESDEEMPAISPVSWPRPLPETRVPALPEAHSTPAIVELASDSARPGRPLPRPDIMRPKPMPSFTMPERSFTPEIFKWSVAGEERDDSPAAVMARLREAAKDPLKMHAWHDGDRVDGWRFGAARNTRLIAKVSIRDQNLKLYRDGYLAETWKVSTGLDSFPSDPGIFDVSFLSRHHKSSIYESAPMPCAIFYNGGEALHATTATHRLGHKASHGCVRLSHENACRLFDEVKQHGKSTLTVIVE